MTRKKKSIIFATSNNEIINIMETKQKKINRIAKEIYKYPIFCGKYFYCGYNDKEEAEKILEELKQEYPNDKWKIKH